MVYEFEELYIAGFIQMFIWWKKKLFFYYIWFIDYEKERNIDLCLGEKYTYKSWFACIYMVINKIYMVTIWSNSSHTKK